MLMSGWLSLPQNPRRRVPVFSNRTTPSSVSDAKRPPTRSHARRDATLKRGGVLSPGPPVDSTAVPDILYRRRIPFSDPP